MILDNEIKGYHTLKSNRSSTRNLHMDVDHHSGLKVQTRSQRTSHNTSLEAAEDKENVHP